MARQKRLIGLDTLSKGNELLDLGVPLSKVHTQLSLDKEWSYNSTVIVFNADRQGLTASTRPDWLQAGPKLQETPPDWEYIGIFPEGYWQRTTPTGLEQRTTPTGLEQRTQEES